MKLPKLSEGEVNFLAPYMPALFGLDLPPCGAHVQIAYEIVTCKLRENWLLYRGQESALTIVHDISKHLDMQNQQWPPGFLHGGFKRRKPWCREEVFEYQLRLIKYFVREAKELAAIEASEKKKEGEGKETEKKAKEGSGEARCPTFVVPPELGFDEGFIDVNVEARWLEWHEKKRAFTPRAPNKFVEWKNYDDEEEGNNGPTDDQNKGNDEEDKAIASADKDEVSKNEHGIGSNGELVDRDSIPPSSRSKKNGVFGSFFGGR